MAFAPVRPDRMESGPERHPFPAVPEPGLLDALGGAAPLPRLEGHLVSGTVPAAVRAEPHLGVSRLFHPADCRDRLRHPAGHRHRLRGCPVHGAGKDAPGPAGRVECRGGGGPVLHPADLPVADRLLRGSPADAHLLPPGAAGTAAPGTALPDRPARRGRDGRLSPDIAGPAPATWRSRSTGGRTTLPGACTGWCWRPGPRS